MRHILLTTACLLIALTASADKKDKVTADARQQIDSLTRLSNDLRQRIGADSLTIAALRQANDSLQSELNELTLFKTEFIKDKLLGQGPDLEQPFSKADAKAVDDYIVRLTAFKGTKDIDEQLQRAETFQRYQTLYRTYSLLLDMPFAREGIGDAFTDITKNLKTKVGTELTEAQYADFDLLAVYLSRYYPGGKDFQALISDVDAKLKNYKGNTDEASRDFCRELALKVLAQHEETVQKRIMPIPYLRQRYETYTASLKDNPLRLTAEAEKAVSDINNLKLD